MGEDSAPNRTISVVVDGRTIAAPEGALLINALADHGVDVPHLCYDRRLAPAGACRLCIVEVDGMEIPIPSCTLPVSDGLVVRTQSPALAQRRQMILEMLAQQYPAGEAARSPEKPLSRYFLEHGIDGKLPLDPARPVDDSHPYIRVDMSRCISCFRCVSICADLQGQFVWQVMNRDGQLRIEPDSGTTLLASTCTSCGACADTCPTGAIDDKPVLVRGLPESYTRTTCPYCGTGCEMEVGTRGQRIVASRPVFDAPVSKGHLCVKGRYAWDFVHASDRVTEPMIRQGDAWHTVSWDEALSFVASTLERIRAQHGPDSIGVLGSARATNEDNYVAQKLARVVIGTNNVDCCARVCHAPTAAAMNRMLGAGAATNSFDDIEDTRLILLCGSNATENHPIVGARMKHVVLGGVPLIVIDPRGIEMARLATFHLRLRAGTNVPLLHALANVIVEEKLYDEAFVRDRVGPTDAYFAFLRDFTPEKVAPVTGVDAGLIRGAARAYATTRPAMSFHGLGVTEHTQGTEGVMCIVNLALLTGNLGKRGAGVNPLRGQNNVQGSAHMGCEPAHLTGYADLSEASDRFAAAWGARPPASRGLDMLQMLDGAKAGSLRALVAIGYDVLLTNPQAGQTEDALRALDLVVVQDMFMNETARRCGTVFLPATSSFEKDGTFMNSERRIQRVRKVIEPVGNARADWEITCALAAKMGHASAFAFRSAEEIWNEIRAVWPAGRGISYARLEHGGLQWPCPTEDHPGTRLLHATRFGRSERADLQCIPFRPTPELRDASYPFTLITGRTLHQFNAGTMTMRTRNAELRPRDLLEVCSEDARRLGLSDGQSVRIESRYGDAILPVAVNERMSRGEVFATFHTVDAFLNRVTGPHRDGFVDTPEYKVTAVRLLPLGSAV